MSANSEYFPERSCKPKKANVAAVTSSPKSREKKPNPKIQGNPLQQRSPRRYLLIIVLSTVIGEREGKGGGPPED